MAGNNNNSNNNATHKRLRPRPRPASSSASSAGAAAGSSRRNNGAATGSSRRAMDGPKRFSTLSQTAAAGGAAAASVRTHQEASQPCDYEAPLNEPVVRGQPKSKMRRSRAGRKFRKQLGLASPQQQQQQRQGSGGGNGSGGASGGGGAPSAASASAMKRSASDGSVYLLGERSDRRRAAHVAPATRAKSEGGAGYCSSYSDVDDEEYDANVNDNDDDERSMMDSASRDLGSDEIDEYANPHHHHHHHHHQPTPTPAGSNLRLPAIPTAAAPSAKELLRRSNEVQEEVQLRRVQGEVRKQGTEQKAAAARLEMDRTAPIDLGNDEGQQQRQRGDVRPSELTHVTDNRASSLVDQFDVDDGTSVVTSATPCASNVEIRRLYEEGTITKAEYVQMVQADERFEMANYLGVDASAAAAAAAARQELAAVPPPTAKSTSAAAVAAAPASRVNPYLPVSRLPSDESETPPDLNPTRTEDTSDEAVVHQYSSESTMQTPDSEDLSHAVHQVEARPRTTTPIKPRRGSMSETSSHREEANAARLAAARRHAMRRLSTGVGGGPTPQRKNRLQQEQAQTTADADADADDAGPREVRPGMMARRRSSLEVGDEVPNPYGRPLPREHLFSARHIQGRRASAGSSYTDASGDVSSITPESEPRRNTWSGADKGNVTDEGGRKLPGGISKAALQHGLGTAEKKGIDESIIPGDPAPPTSKFKNPWAPMAKGGAQLKGKGAMGKKGASDLIERNTISTAPSSNNARPSGGAWEVTQVEGGGDMTAEEIEELQAFSQAAKSWGKKKGKAKKGKKTSTAVAAILDDVQEAQMDEEDEGGITLPQGPDASASLVISRPPTKSKKPKRSLKAEADAAADQRIKRLEKASRAVFAAEQRQQKAKEAKHYSWDERNNTKSSAKEIAQRSKVVAAKPSSKQDGDDSLDTEERAMARRVQQLEAETGAGMSRCSSHYPSSSIDQYRTSEATMDTGPSSSVQPSSSDHYLTSEGSLQAGHSTHRPSSTSTYTNTSTSYQKSSKASKRLERIESGIEFEEDSREGLAADGNLYPIGEDSTHASSFISKKQQKKLQRVMNNAAKRHMSHMSSISNDVSVMTDSGNGLTVATDPSLINAESEAQKSNDIRSESPPVNESKDAELKPLTTFTEPLKSPDTDGAVAKSKSEKAKQRKSSRLSEASTDFPLASADQSAISGLANPSEPASAAKGLFPVESLQDMNKPTVVLPKQNGSNSSPDYEKIAVEENIWRHVNELLDDCLSIMDGPGEDSSSASGTYVSEGVDAETVTSRMTRKSHDWDLLSQIGAGESDRVVQKRGQRVKIDEIEEISKAKAALASFNDYFHDPTESFRSGATEAFEKTWTIASRASSVASFGEDYSLTHLEGGTSAGNTSVSNVDARPKTNVAVSRSILRGSLKELSRRNIAIDPNTDSESVGATRAPMQEKDAARIMPETKEEMWVRRGLESIEDAKLGKIAIDTFSNVLVESMPIGIQAAIMDHADETGVVLKDAAEMDLNGIDIAPEKKALLAGPHLTLYEVFCWSLQVNVDHLVKAEGAEERRKRKELEKERAKHTEENEHFEEAFEQFLDEALAKETEKAAEAAMASPERNYLPEILHPIQEEDSRPFSSEQSRVSSESSSQDSDTTKSVLSAALKLGAVAAEEDNMKEEDVSADPSLYLSTMPDGESGDEPFDSVMRNRRRSSMLSTLEEVEEKSSSEMSDDTKLNQLLGLNEIQSQEEEEESKESKNARRASLTPAALERAAGIRSISNSSDMRRSSSGTTHSSAARPSALLPGGIANAAARHGLIRSNGMGSLHANSSSSQGISRTSSGMTRASSGMARSSSLTTSTSGPGILRSRYSSLSSSLGTTVHQERRASDPVSTSTSCRESSVTVESSENEGRSVRFAMPRGQNINRSEIDRMREEFGLVRDIETKTSDPFEKAISDYNQSFSRPSEISESATRLIKELQEMRRKKEETDSSQTRLAVSSRFQPKIIDEGQQQNGVLVDYSTRSKSSLRSATQDEDFAETLSIFAESAKLTFVSNSSSSKTPGSSSAGTNGSGGHQATMHLFTENDSSAYASSSATGTTNAHTLSGSDTYYTKESSKDPSAYARDDPQRVPSSKSLLSSISSGLDDSLDNKRQ